MNAGVEEAADDDGWGELVAKDANDHNDGLVEDEAEEVDGAEEEEDDGAESGA